MKLLFDFIFEVLFANFFNLLFRLVFVIGEFIVLLFIWDIEAKEQYKLKSKDSALPYFIGFSILIGTIYLLF